MADVRVIINDGERGQADALARPDGGGEMTDRRLRWEPAALACGLRRGLACA
jgi:hypothetical protein